MSKASYKNVRRTIQNMLNDDEFEIIDEAMSGKEGTKLVVGAKPEVFSKQVSSFQSGVTVEGLTIKGTLKEVTEQWTEAGFSENDHYFVYLLADTNIDQSKYDIKVGINQLTVLDDEKDIVIAVKKNNKKPVKLQIVDKTTGEIVDDDSYTLAVTFEPEQI